MSELNYPPDNTALAGLQCHYLSGGKLALLLDYDGTLTPIVERPELAVLSASTRQLLADLRDLPDVVVGVLSGRSLADLGRMVGLSGLYYAGTAGLELEFPGGRIDHPRAAEAGQLADELADRLQPLADACPGAWIERKPLGLAVHYRGAAAATAAELVARVTDTLRPSADQLRVLYGPMAIEVAPALGWTKATALERIVDAAAGSGLVAGTGVRVLPLYAGDSENDADALAAAERMGGVGLGVGPDAPPAASRRLADPAALIVLMGVLREQLRAAASARKAGR